MYREFMHKYYNNKKYLTGNQREININIIKTCCCFLIKGSTLSWWDDSLLGLLFFYILYIVQ